MCQNGKQYGRILLRRLLCTLLAIVTASAPAVADAFVYTDTENQLRLFIPENTQTYYYTPEQANLFEDLLEQLQSSGHDVRVLVRTYSDTNALGYSLQINSEPLPGAAPEEGAAPPGSIYRDALLLPEEDRNAAAQSIRSAYESRFSFSEPVPSTLSGLPALEMDGTGIADTAWARYDCKAYILAAQDRLITVVLILENTGLYRSAGLNMLDSLTLGSGALASQTAPSEESPEPSNTAAPPSQSLEAAASASAAPASVQDHAMPQGTLNSFRPYILAGGLTGAAVIVILLIVRAARRRKRNAADSDSISRAADAMSDSFKGSSEQAAEGSGINPVGTPGTESNSPAEAEPAEVSEVTGTENTDQSGDTKQFPPAGTEDIVSTVHSGDRHPEENSLFPADSESETDGEHVSYVADYVQSDKEDSTEMSSDDSRYIANGHDYTEDVSRYTQQPSADVNDVSRYTHGVGRNVDDDLQGLKDMPAERHRSRPSVGSRVERNKSRARRKK